MLEVVSEFRTYDGDKQDMRGRYVDDTRIDFSVPFSAKELTLPSQAVLSRWSFPKWTLVLAQILIT
ncbi:TPA: hypothetical protein ACH3X1_001146 [Trebouxia sp. C0004]